jgi:hypothetical protein
MSPCHDKENDMAKGATIELLESVVDGNDVHATVRIAGNVTNLTGTKKNWEVMADYTLEVTVSLKELFQGWGSSQRISLAGKLRDTSASFVNSIEGKVFSPKVLDALIEANRLPSGDLDKKEAELMAKLEAIRAAKSKRDE